MGNRQYLVTGVHKCHAFYLFKSRTSAHVNVINAEGTEEDYQYVHSKVNKSIRTSFCREMHNSLYYAKLAEFTFDMNNASLKILTFELQRNIRCSV